MDRKDARLDLRMDREQKDVIGKAAAARGMSVSQWAIDRLVSAAHADLLEDKAMRLSARAFDEFAALLEEPQDSTFEAFLAEKTIWDA
jgi:uncharacterized protein (DUF1778 family)